MSNLSEISHVRMFLNLQSDLEGMFMLLEKNSLLTFFARIAFLNLSSVGLSQLASSPGCSGGGTIRALQGAC